MHSSKLVWGLVALSSIVVACGDDSSTTGGGGSGGEATTGNPTATTTTSTRSSRPKCWKAKNSEVRPKVWISSARMATPAARKGTMRARKNSEVPGR